MGDDDFERLLDEYLDPPSDPNPEMAGVQIEWIRNQENYGSLHIRWKHKVTEAEVEEVLFEIPPYVEAKRHPTLPGRTVFWGATKKDRWLFVVCEDRKEGNQRILTPITAFPPDKAEEYWKNLT
jgi:hypothetical protein